jgi:hypothetical protein
MIHRYASGLDLAGLSGSPNAGRMGLRPVSAGGIDVSPSSLASAAGGARDAETRMIARGSTICLAGGLLFALACVGVGAFYVREHRYVSWLNRGHASNTICGESGRMGMWLSVRAMERMSTETTWAPAVLHVSPGVLRRENSIGVQILVWCVGACPGILSTARVVMQHWRRSLFRLPDFFASTGDFAVAAREHSARLKIRWPLNDDLAFIDYRFADDVTEDELIAMHRTWETPFRSDVRGRSE